MAGIELVIKMPEEMYKWVCDVNKFSNDYGTGDFIDLIKNGKPLPKGHGRLIDENDLKTLYGLDDRLWWSNAVEEFPDLPTIIEADKCTYKETGCGSCKRQLDCPIEADRKERERMTPQEASEELKEEFEVFKPCIKKADWENPNEELRKIIEANTMAIEVLGQQPCEDSVSREAVNALIDELARAISDERCFVSRGRATSLIMRDILALPSVTPKAKWIPVSERLPEEDGMYLVSIEGNITHKIIVDIAHWFECEKSNNGFYTANEVFAWMPLPQPYKTESEEAE